MRLRLIPFLVAVMAVLVPSNATAQPAWAPADGAAVHPGVQTFTDGAQCTANFVFTNGSDVLIGQAAHCAGTGAATDTNGCEADTLPLGTQVEVDGASRPGTLVYSSWVTMQGNGENDEDTCAYNDFALVKLDPSDVDVVNPSVPHWGGPTSVGATTGFGDRVYSYGNSGLRFGLTPTSPKEGYSLGQSGGGWTHDIYTVTPGIPGDSGSGVLSDTGAALGTLSTVAALPFPASNGVGDLAHELAYARQQGGFTGLQLALGTEPFVGGVLP